MSKPAKQPIVALSLVFAISSLTACSQISHLFAHRKPPAAKQTPIASVSVYGLEEMSHRVAEHGTPDAMVYISPQYDAAKPIHLVVYNHGMMTDLKQVEDTWKISQHMKNAAPNTVLIAPEWALHPHDLSSAAGDFNKPGFFKGMLEEIFAKIPELQNRKLSDISDIHLSSFSGGLYALIAELQRNDLGDRVQSVTLYDSLYNGRSLDNWLHDNLADLASGKKQYNNFYFHTWPASVQQLHRIKQMLTAQKLPDHCMRCDLEDPHTVMEAEKVATRSIIFKNTMANIDDTFTGHMATAKTYIPVVLKAMALRQRGYNETDLKKSEVAKRKLEHDGVRKYM
jgi:hypothetical protein